MEALNAAQQLLSYLGVPVGSVPKQANGNKNASATKAGSGRYHVAGHTKTGPAKSKGAPRDFVQHMTDANRRTRRAAIKSMGIRQYKKLSV